MGSIPTWASGGVRKQASCTSTASLPGGDEEERLSPFSSCSLPWGGLQEEDGEGVVDCSPFLGQTRPSQSYRLVIIKRRLSWLSFSSSPF